MAVLYTLAASTMVLLVDVKNGVVEPPPDFFERAHFYLQCQFAIIVMFWTTLWAVKFAILLFYKKLFNKLPTQMKLWWGVLGAVSLFYVGCWISQLESCHPIEGYFTLGK